MRTLRPLRVRFRSIALVAWVAGVAWGLSGVARRTVDTLSAARHSRGLTLVEARKRAFGATYTGAIETIRRTIPVEEPYLLIPEDALPEEGWDVAVRYDLAPRLPLLVPSLDRLRTGRQNERRVPSGVRWAVVRQASGVPEAVSITELRRRLGLAEPRR